MHFLPTTFAGRGPQLRKQRPSFGDHGSHFTRKKTQGFAPESLFKPELKRSRPVTLRNYLMMMMMVMMMMVTMMMVMVMVMMMMVMVMM